jgi:hypothetical protein
MEKRDKAEELVSSMRDFGNLEDVPTDISLRYQATLASLVLPTPKSQPKKNWQSGGNQFALAASFTLVFALGAVITLNLGAESSESVSVTQNQTQIQSEDNGVKDDQLLYSAGEGSVPQISISPIKLSNSGHEYASIPTGLPGSLGVGATWNSGAALDSKTQSCLKSLGLDQSTNLIDSGYLNGGQIQAIWAPVTEKSWNVYLVDSNCSAIDKKYFSK